MRSMSEPLFSSSFEYVTQSLVLTNFKELNKLSSKYGNNQATYPSLMDYYANRENVSILKPVLNNITSFYKFIYQ